MLRHNKTGKKKQRRYLQYSNVLQIILYFIRKYDSFCIKYKKNKHIYNDIIKMHNGIKKVDKF